MHDPVLSSLKMEGIRLLFTLKVLLGMEETIRVKEGKHYFPFYMCLLKVLFVGVFVPENMLSLRSRFCVKKKHNVSENGYVWFVS
jgi:hypothetical protein